MAYKILNNTGFALDLERENGFIVLFRWKDDFKDYRFDELEGKAIVEAIWSPSGFIEYDSFFLSKLWFAADAIRSFNDLRTVKRDPAYPERFIEEPVMTLKESVFRALVSGSLEEVPDDELQDVADLGGFGSRFVDDLRRARKEVERFAYLARYKDGTILPAHDQKVIIMVNGEKNRVDPSLLLYSRDYLLPKLVGERLHRGLLGSSYQDAWQSNVDVVKSNLEIQINNVNR